MVKRQWNSRMEIRPISILEDVYEDDIDGLE